MATFRVAGPGAANIEMDRGLALIEPYAEKLDYFEAQRLDLSEFNGLHRGRSEGQRGRQRK